MRKSYALERMDTESISQESMSQVLQFLSMTNRHFGGARVILDKLEQWDHLWTSRKPLRILDVGTGLADIPLAIASWAEAKNYSVELTGIDIVEDIVAMAQTHVKHHPQIQVLKADVFQLLEAEYDVVVASLFFHHVPPQQYVPVLKKLDSLARQALVLSDLIRSPFSYAAVGLLSYLAGNSIVRHDGPLSVRRAFTVEELSGYVRDAGLNYLHVKKEPWHRVSVSGTKV